MFLFIYYLRFLHGFTNDFLLGISYCGDPFSSLGVRCISPTIISPTPHFTDNYFTDSSFRRQFISPTVHFTDSSFRRQFISPTVISVISPTTFIVHELVTWLLDLNRVSYFSCILLYAPTLFNLSWQTLLL